MTEINHCLHLMLASSEIKISQFSEMGFRNPSPIPRHGSSPSCRYTRRSQQNSQLDCTSSRHFHHCLMVVRSCRDPSYTTLDESSISSATPTLHIHPAFATRKLFHIIRLTTRDFHHAPLGFNFSQLQLTQMSRSSMTTHCRNARILIP